MTLTATIRAATNAPDTGRMVLRVRSDSPAPGFWGTVTIDYTFSGEASPALYWTPNFVETGVAISNMVTEEITLENRGFAPMRDVQACADSDQRRAGPGMGDPELGHESRRARRRRQEEQSASRSLRTAPRL